MGLTMKRMSEKIGVSEASVSRLESGKQAMTIPLARRLEEVTGIPSLFWAFPDKITHPDLKGGERVG